ncbi:hypothetical protein BX600DRAFT_432060 [Xylariales sp. PMI_506]|nr:hypothetical protein BX600DRAFT_432060 [Xylariales sp. PMI_506]
MKKNSASPIIKVAPSATPTPIPALVPDESPLDELDSVVELDEAVSNAIVLEEPVVAVVPDTKSEAADRRPIAHIGSQNSARRAEVSSTMEVSAIERETPVVHDVSDLDRNAQRPLPLFPSTDTLEATYDGQQSNMVFPDTDELKVSLLVQPDGHSAGDAVDPKATGQHAVS